MPDQWFEDYSSLYEACRESGRLPAIWAECRTAMLPTDDGGFRPLSMASVAWRAASSTHITKLGRWTNQWAAEELAGGLAGREGRHMHARI